MPSSSLCFSLLSLFFLLLLSRPPLTSTRPVPNDLRSIHIPTFLHKFGYLAQPLTTITTSSDKAEFKSAVSLYQTRHGLAVTGRLDPATLAQISTPRCGVSDIMPTAVDDRVVAVSRYTYFRGKPRWNRARPMTLSYALSSTKAVSYIPRSDVEAAIRRAFDRWARVIPVKFIPAADYGAADIKLGFFSGDHGDGTPFDGPLGVFGHAFSPDSGRIHLDAAERWAVDFGKERSAAAVDLETVVTHEIGHVLGLQHSAVREAVMFPTVSVRTKKVALTMDDVEGVQSLYGSNPNFNISSVLESDTSGAAGDSRRRNYFIGILAGVLVFVCIVVRLVMF